MLVEAVQAGAGFIDTLDEVDSTMLEARRRIVAGLAAPAMIVAKRQVAGYGRHARTWHSPEGGLWATLAHPLSAADPDQTNALGLRMGIAATRTVIAALAAAATASSAVKLKWPNDVLLNERKVCGVIVERTDSPRGPWVLVGVGINANNDPDELPHALRRPPTSLARETRRDFDLDELARLLRGQLMAALREPLSHTTLQWAAARLWRMDEPIVVSSGTGAAMNGVLRGLSQDGRMVLEVEGRRFTVPQGVEVVG